VNIAEVHTKVAVHKTTPASVFIIALVAVHELDLFTDVTIISAVACSLYQIDADCVSVALNVILSVSSHHFIVSLLILQTAFASTSVPL
jgi:hypothetical protein